MPKLTEILTKPASYCVYVGGGMMRTILIAILLLCAAVLGAEAEWSASYSDGYDDDAFYAGPNICYEAESWWATLCVAPRLFSRDPELGHDVRVVVQLGYVF